MSNLACLAKARGHDVSGSDNSLMYEPSKSLLAQSGIVVSEYSGLPDACPDVVVVGGTIRPDNPEYIYYSSNDFALISLVEALHELAIQGSETIVVAGTHGKSTSSALLSHVLHRVDCKHGWFVGGIPRSFPAIKSVDATDAFFVSEGDEYRTCFFDQKPKFLNLSAKHLLCTNVEWDHANIYPDVSVIEDLFCELFASLPEHGIFVANSESKHLRNAIVKSGRVAVELFGKDSDWQIRNYSSHGTTSRFEITYQRKGECVVTADGVPGMHNAQNILGCFVLLRNLGVPRKAFEKAVRSFRGVTRRFHIRYHDSSLVLIDDFAHHPTAIRETLNATRLSYPSHRLVAFMQPATFSSCLAVFQDEYVAALKVADISIIDRPRRQLEEVKQLDVEQLVECLIANGIEAHSTAKPDEFISQFLGTCKQPTVFVGMSVASLDWLFSELLSNR